MAPFLQRKDQVETKTAGTRKVTVVDLEVWSNRFGKRSRWHPTHWGSHLKLFLGQLSWKYLEADTKSYSLSPGHMFPFYRLDIESE